MRRREWLATLGLLLVACSNNAGPTLSEPTTSTTTAEKPLTPVNVARTLPPASTLSNAWREELTIPYGESEDPDELVVGASPEYAAPGGNHHWAVLDAANGAVLKLFLDDSSQEWRSYADPYPPGARGFQFPFQIGWRLFASSTDGRLLIDSSPDIEVVDTGAGSTAWTYSDGVSLFSSDGRALDPSGDSDVSVRDVDALRMPSDDHFRVAVDGSALVVELPDLGRRIQVALGLPADAAVGAEFAADLSGTLHLLLTADVDGTQYAGYLTATYEGIVSEIEPVRDPYGPADPGSPSHLRVIPDTTTVALTYVDEDALRIYTRVSPDIVGIVSADLPEETCQWVRDYAVEASGRAPTMKLEQGHVPGFPTGYGGTYLDSSYGVLRPDLDRDGERDAVIVIWCSAGGSGQSTEIHGIGPNGSSLGRVEIGEETEPPSRNSLYDLDVDGQDIVVTYSAGEDDEPSCCPSRKVTDRYRWRGGDFVRVDRRIFAAADAGQAILKAINDRDDRASNLADRDVFKALRRLRDQHGALQGCRDTSGAQEWDDGERFCVIAAADDPSSEYRLLLASTDFGKWRATGLVPLPGS